MSDKEEESSVPEKPFFAERAKTGRSACKKCKEKIDSGVLRVAKLATNPFGTGTMKMWHHLLCLFELFKKQRATTVRINTPDDIGGWDLLTDEDHKEILNFLPEYNANNPSNSDNQSKTVKGLPDPSLKKVKNTKDRKANDTKQVIVTPTEDQHANHKDNSFREFRRLCADIANEPSYNGKTAIVKKLFNVGSDQSSFKGNMLLWCNLLLPGAVKRVYNLQSKQLIKLFSRIFDTDYDQMLIDLEQGDVAETIRVFFEKSLHLKPIKKSTLTLYEVNEFLSQLSKMTKEDEQTKHFEIIAKRCSSNDLKMIIRLIKHDLRINAGPKHILDAVHQDAYEAFQASRDIGAILSRVFGNSEEGVSSMDQSKAMEIKVNLMTPIQPMLAEPCKAIEHAMKKCPNGMYSEIKYDGERVQVHKQGAIFKYYSRSLKPVMAHKVSHFKEFIPQAFPHGKDLILDAEILLIDTATGNPLPFGTLGVHKKTAFEHANVCLFVFDCLYYNGELLIDRPVQERRQILEKNMSEIKNHIMFSEMKLINSSKQLEAMITDVFKKGLEGLVLKDVLSTYEPGKRHWLKVKKDYLFGGAMADTVDLVVLGAWFGTGAKGGMMSSFLMGVFDLASTKWCTVTKVHGGHDDATLQSLQTELNMVKISKDASLVPDWLNATKTMVPDFVARDPKSMPVWEITGAEFTQHNVHTANGISIRFPRITKIRNDKDWKTSTSLEELDNLYKKSKENSDFSFPGCTNRPSGEDSKTPTPKETTVVKPKTQIQKKLTFGRTNGGSSSSTKDQRKAPKNVDSPSKNETEHSPNKRMKLLKSPQKPLPDFFKRLRILLPKIARDYATLERYLIAYGGSSLTPSQAIEATHVIYINNVCEKHSWPSTAHHVDINWLWTSIKLQSIQNTKLFTIQPQ